VTVQVQRVEHAGGIEEIQPHPLSGDHLVGVLGGLGMVETLAVEAPLSCS